MQRLLCVLFRGARLRCPCCGCGSLFRRGFTLHERCAACDEQFEREPGLGLGAIYVNLALTILLVLSAAILAEYLTNLTPARQFLLLITLTAVIPVALFRVAKGIWLGLIFLGEGLYLEWPSH